MLARLHHLSLVALLAVSLVVSGQATAHAKGASPATGHMVLCSGGGIVVVFTDADGQPTAPPHICPDCLVAALLAVPDQTTEAHRFVPPGIRLVSVEPVVRYIGARITDTRARAPPVPV